MTKYLKYLKKYGIYIKEDQDKYSSAMKLYYFVKIDNIEIQICDTNFIWYCVLKFYLILFIILNKIKLV